MYRLVAMDLDGTLLDGSKEIPAEVAEYLSRLTERGVHIALVSGRTPNVGEHFAGKIGKCSLVAYNGSYIRFEDGKVSGKKVDAGVVRDIAEFSHGYESFIVAYDEGKILIEDSRLDISADVDSKHSILTEIGDMSEIEADSPKVVILAHQETIDEMLPVLRRRHPELNVTQSSGFVIEIMPKGANKASGLDAVCRDLGIDRDETVGIGDYLNDISMLEWVGYPVAVANAHPEVKKIAKLVTDREMSYGVLEALKKIFP